MKKLFTLFIALTFIMCLSAQAQVTLPVTDNFPSGGAELAWSDYDSAYEAIEAFSPTAPGGDGYVMNVNDGSGWQFIHLTDDDGSLGDYKITAYIYMPSDTSGWCRVGIIGRAQTIDYDADCYYLFADSDGDDYLRCGRYYDSNHNSWDNYIDPPGTITRDAWHKWELSLNGSEIIAEIDDVVVHSGNEATDFTAGYFGLITYQNGTTSSTLCDRITVEATGASVVDWSLY